MSWGDFVKTIGKLGKKVLGGAAKLGKKVAGKVAHIGGKVSDVAGGVVNFVDKVPILGDVLAPITRNIKKVLGVVDSATSLANKTTSGIERAEMAVANRDIGALKDIAKGGVKGMKDARRLSVGFGTGVRDSVMGAKGVAKNVRGRASQARQALN